MAAGRFWPARCFCSASQPRGRVADAEALGDLGGDAPAGRGRPGRPRPPAAAAAPRRRRSPPPPRAASARFSDSASASAWRSAGDIVLLGQVDAGVARQIPQDLHERALLDLGHEREHVTLFTTAEAVEELPRLVHVKGRRLLGVERTQAHPARRARALQLDVPLDDLDDVRALTDVVNLFARNQRQNATHAARTRPTFNSSAQARVKRNDARNDAEAAYQITRRNLRKVSYDSRAASGACPDGPARPGRFPRGAPPAGGHVARCPAPGAPLLPFAALQLHLVRAPQDDELDAAVLAPAVLVVLGADRLGLAVALRAQPLRLDPALLEAPVAPSAARRSVRSRLYVVVAALVGVALDLDQLDAAGCP